MLGVSVCTAMFMLGGWWSVVSKVTSITVDSCFIFIRLMQSSHLLHEGCSCLKFR